MFCRPSTGRSGNLPRSIDEYAGVNNLTSCPAACRYLVSAEDTSARPPVFDRGAGSDARRQTVRVIMRLPVYDVGQSAPQGGVEVILAIEQGGRGSPMRRFLIGLVVVLLD